MATVRTHVIFQADILRDIDSLVGKRGRSAFLADAAKLEIERRKVLNFLELEQNLAWKRENWTSGAQVTCAAASRSGNKLRRAEEQARATENRLMIVLLDTIAYSSIFSTGGASDWRSRGDLLAERHRLASCAVTVAEVYAGMPPE